MPKKRSNGEGGIWKRKDGKWIGVLHVGWEPVRDKETGRRVLDADGAPKMRRVRRHFVGDKREEVAKRLSDAAKEFASVGSLPDNKETVESYLAWWLRDELPGTVKESTAAGYSTVLHRYVTPHLGRAKLASLTPKQLTTWMRRLEADGLSPRTRKQARAIFHRALRDAVDKEILTRNPMTTVRGPSLKGDKGKKDALTADQARAVIAATRQHVMPETRAKQDPMAAPRFCDVRGCRNRGHALEAAFTLALHTGLRRGEFLGLRWSDVDLEAGKVSVRQTVKWLPGHGVMFDTPKSEAGSRSFRISAAVVESLKAHRVKQNAERLAAKEWTETDLIFSTSTGTAYDPRFVLRMYQAASERAGLGKLRLHGCRHTAATLMLNQGVPLERVGKMLGHADFRITVDVYGEFDEDSTDGAEAMEAALGVG